MDIVEDEISEIISRRQYQLHNMTRTRNNWVKREYA